MYRFFNTQFILYSEVCHKIAKAMKELDCKAAVCQMTSTNDKLQNYNIVSQLVEKAKSDNAAMVFLPEGCDYIARNPDEAKELAEPIDGQLITDYCGLAVKYKIWLSIGGFHEKLEGQEQFYNTHIIINSSGNIVTKYRKLHLFDVDAPDLNLQIRESDVVIPGKEMIQPVDTPVGKLGLAICYDLRFPEMSALLTRAGAHVLAFPSAFMNSTGALHWESLLRARAIENQCYVVAPAQIGQHNDNRTSYGKAMIIDPKGIILNQCECYGEGEHSPNFISNYLDSEYLNRVRAEMPVSTHRRQDIYTLSCARILPNVDESQERTFVFWSNPISEDIVFYESPFSFAFTNIRCVVPGHVLVASKRIVKRLPDLDNNEIADLFQTVAKIQKIVESAYECTSSTIVVQDGVDAGQTVQHVHVHVLPRKPGDFEKNDDIYEALQKHDKHEEKPERSADEMRTEAIMLRNQVSQ